MFCYSSTFREIFLIKKSHNHLHPLMKKVFWDSCWPSGSNLDSFSVICSGQSHLSALFAEVSLILWMKWPATCLREQFMQVATARSHVSLLFREKFAVYYWIFGVTSGDYILTSSNSKQKWFWCLVSLHKGGSLSIMGSIEVLESHCFALVRIINVCIGFVT